MKMMSQHLCKLFFIDCMGFLYSPPCPDWFWSPSSLLSSGYRALRDRTAEIKNA